MGIDVKGNVVVLDEAHNIEDVSRAAASKDFSMDDLDVTIEELQKVTASDECAADPEGTRMDLYTAFSHVLKNMRAWALQQAGNLIPGAFEQEQRVWDGEEAICFLEEWGIKAENVTNLRKSLNDIVDESKDSTGVGRTLNGRAVGVLEALLTVCELLCGGPQSGANAPRFRLVLMKVSAWQHAGGFAGRKQSAAAGQSGQRVWTHRIGFWCLDPAVAFNQLSSAAYSIILTSGECDAFCFPSRSLWLSGKSLDWKIYPQAPFLRWIPSPVSWVVCLTSAWRPTMSLRSRKFLSRSSGAAWPVGTPPSLLSCSILS